MWGEIMRQKKELNKYCIKCGILLSDDNWSLSRKRNEDYVCKKCCNERAKKWAKKHPEQVKRLLKRFRTKLKLEVFSHYSNGLPKCSCCGETHIDFLSIDHVEGNGNKHRQKIHCKAGLNFYKWLKTYNFPQGYQVLCMNCQFGKMQNNGFCPHKIKALKGAVQ